jgi:hypothetical protein
VDGVDVAGKMKRHITRLEILRPMCETQNEAPDANQNLFFYSLFPACIVHRHTIDIHAKRIEFEFQGCARKRREDKVN